MFELSFPRIRRLTLILGVGGAVAIWGARGPKEAASFLVGALLSLASFHSWMNLAESLDGSGKRPIGASVAFLALRYVLIGGAVYVIVKFLGIAPVAMIVGLLASFAAVVVELLYGRAISK
jgi:hypothetical protein